METDILIVGSGCSALYTALKLPEDKKITLITKSDLESSDSFLAQGGICVLAADDDYDDYFEDTMRAGHYENDKKSVEIMIKSSPKVIEDLINFGVDFRRDENGNLVYTREGAHSRKRILFHKDITGREITSKLLANVKKLKNITILENTTMLDILCADNICYGAVVRKSDNHKNKETDISGNKENEIMTITAKVTVFATGGIGGLYKHSTNFRHLTGDGLAIALKHGIEVEHADYVQIHPTTLYEADLSKRSFLISESVRGEGAKLYDKNMNRFVDELLPRDVVTKAILNKMEEDGTEFVWEDLRTIPHDELAEHFPNIVEYCRKIGYDVFNECIPVVPAQHYHMGGIKVNHESRTSMECLYVVGEAACNGVHGKNRLASNSLLESLVFAGRAADDMIQQSEFVQFADTKVGNTLSEEADLESYKDAEKLEKEYRELVWNEIKKAEKRQDIA